MEETCLLERVFTFSTRLQPKNIEYFKEYIADYSKLQRRIWQDLKHGEVEKTGTSKYVTKLCNQFGFMKRTVNSCLRDMKGRLSALTELRKTEIKQKEQKLETLRNKVEAVEKEVKTLRKEVICDCNNKEPVKRYNNLKTKLYWYKDKINRLKTEITNYYNPDYDNLKVCWGTKDLFLKQYRLEENGYKTHEKWLNDFRKNKDKQIVYLGAAAETSGNQMFQLQYNSAADNFSFKVRKENKYSNADKYVILDNIEFKYDRNLIRSFVLKSEIPLTYRIRRVGNSWYLDIIFKVYYQVPKKHHNGCVGVDFNSGFLAVAVTDSSGNLINTDRFNLKYHGTGNKAKTEMQLAVKKLVTYCKEKGKALVIEDLEFSRKKSTVIKRHGKTYNRMIHALDYSRFRFWCENITKVYGVELRIVNPAYTSKIGSSKYSNSKKLNIHTSAAYVIARRGQYFKDVA